MWKINYKGERGTLEVNYLKKLLSQWSFEMLYIHLHTKKREREKLTLLPSKGCNSTDLAILRLLFYNEC